MAVGTERAADLILLAALDGFGEDAGRTVGVRPGADDLLLAGVADANATVKALEHFM
jgi:hypothetical protein